MTTSDGKEVKSSNCERLLSFHHLTHPRARLLHQPAGRPIPSPMWGSARKCETKRTIAPNIRVEKHPILQFSLLQHATCSSKFKFTKAARTLSCGSTVLRRVQMWLLSSALMEHYSCTICCVRLASIAECGSSALTTGSGKKNSFAPKMVRLVGFSLLNQGASLCCGLGARCSSHLEENNRDLTTKVLLPTALEP